jgi:hypothetical protein
MAINAVEKKYKKIKKLIKIKLNNIRKQWHDKHEKIEHRIKDQALLREFWQAHAEWQTAFEKLNYVETEDQMDYAVFLFEAKQKRLEMLLRIAKKRQIKSTLYFR